MKIYNDIISFAPLKNMSKTIKKIFKNILKKLLTEWNGDDKLTKLRLKDKKDETKNLEIWTAMQPWRFQTNHISTSANMRE